ncbi:MAG TPA: sugar phosphate nucleotidyltransferase, partial [Gemmatimonadaceae bacterium]|nr:sugar phosphate nucleotidyltransferase [Gemmatimonadaceae bacterium]
MGLEIELGQSHARRAILVGVGGNRATSVQGVGALRQTPAALQCSLHAPLPFPASAPASAQGGQTMTKREGQGVQHRGRGESSHNVVVPVVPIPGDEPVATLTSEEPQTEAEREAAASMWAIVLAGGIGSRFWPLSTPDRPKQLLKLIGERPLIAETVARLSPLIPPERVLVLTSRDIAPAIHA